MRNGILSLPLVMTFLLTGHVLASEIVTVTSDGGKNSSLAVVDGKPAIAYSTASGSVGFVRAVDSAGSVWNAPSVVAPAPTRSEYLSLAVVAGNPSISYAGWPESECSSKLEYIRATTIDGSAWGNQVVVE